MSWQAYSRLQLALAHFGQPFWMLTADQLPELERQLARKLMLEHQVLAHPLAMAAAEKRLRMPAGAQMNSALCRDRRRNRQTHQSAPRDSPTPEHLPPASTVHSLF